MGQAIAQELAFKKNVARVCLWSRGAWTSTTSRHISMGDGEFRCRDIDSVVRLLPGALEDVTSQAMSHSPDDGLLEYARRGASY